MNDDQIQTAWVKASIIEGQNPEEWRKDSCGAVIRRSRYGDTDDDFGWQVDHIFPQVMLEANDVPNVLIDHDENLRAMHWRNNISKSNNYPRYESVTSSRNGRNNIEENKTMKVNQYVQGQIERLYGPYIDYFFSGDLNTYFDDIDL